VRIAYITDTYLPETNGIVTAIVRHSRGLAERGHEFLILCPRYGLDDPMGQGFVHVERYAAWSASSNAETHVALPWLFSMVRTLRKFDPDLIHIHTPLPIGVTGIVAAKMLGVPNIQTYHSYVPGFMQYVGLRRLLKLDTGPRVTRETWFDWFVTRLIYNRADLVLAPSRVLCDELRRHGLKPRVRHQDNGIILAEFPPKTDWSPRKRIMHCGRLGFEKNAEVVVEAFALFLCDHPDWELHLLGEGPAEPYLRQLIETLEIGDHVRFEGFVDRTYLAECYREADIYATASTIETQGIVVLEAMASGTPVVGVDVLAVPEMARDERHGFMVEPYDPAAMADAFARIADNDALRTRMGGSCVSDVAEHALADVIEHLEKVYEDALAASRQD
jgi:glycosyltransferase involved in cell wall biosynthesis